MTIRSGRGRSGGLSVGPCAAYAGGHFGGGKAAPLNVRHCHQWTPGKGLDCLDGLSIGGYADQPRPNRPKIVRFLA